MKLMGQRYFSPSLFICFFFLVEIKNNIFEIQTGSFIYQQSGSARCDDGNKFECSIQDSFATIVAVYFDEVYFAKTPPITRFFVESMF